MQSPSESQLERKEQARLLATELAEGDQERRPNVGLLELPQDVRFRILLFLDEGRDLGEYACVAKQCFRETHHHSLFLERNKRFKPRFKLLMRAHDPVIVRHNRLVERHNRLFVRIHGTSSVAAANAAPLDSDDSDSDSDVSDSDREERHLDREARRLERLQRLERRCIRSELELYELGELRKRFWLQHRSLIFLHLRKAEPDGEQESFKERFKEAQNMAEEYFRERVQERL